MKMTNRSKKNLLIISILVAAIAVIVIAYFAGKDDKRNREYQPVDSAEQFCEWNDYIVYKGVRYQKNKKLKTILLLGVDNADDLPEGVLIGTAPRADTIYLSILDSKNKTNKLVAVSRDSMTEIDVYDQDGIMFTQNVMQVAMQYEYGTDAKHSCEITKQTISEMLLSLPIDGYTSISLDGIREVVESLGGVTLTFPEDYSYIDPRYTKGATVTLDAWDMDLLLKFRDEFQLESNQDRMNRQEWVLRTVYDQLKNSNLISVLTAVYAMDADKITYDLNLKTIKQLASYSLEDGTYQIPGEIKAGALHAEFHIDEAALMDLLVDLYYLPVE